MCARHLRSTRRHHHPLLRSSTQVEFQPLVNLEEVKVSTGEDEEEVTFKMCELALRPANRAPPRLSPLPCCRHLRLEPERRVLGWVFLCVGGWGHVAADPVPASPPPARILVT